MKSVAPFEVGITVSNLDGILPFYRDVLGFNVLSDFIVPAEKSYPTGLSPSGYRVMRLESSGGDRIKFAQPKDTTAAALTREFALQRQGGSYVTFIVADLDELYARLQQAGVTIKSRGMVKPREGFRMMMVCDPEGNYIEFVEYADLAAYRPGLKP
jgi:lactoylglutathione lyase